MVSVDVEEDISNGNKKKFLGVENLDKILKIFEPFKIKTTLFITGEILAIYPNSVEEWSKVHEIACHGYYHIPLYELSISEREKQLADSCSQYEKILHTKPKGFRAVKHTIDNTQLRLLERFSFTYDSSIIPKYVPFRKYVGYKGKAPTEPYYPSYDNCRAKGDTKILEIPNTPLIFGIPLNGTWLRFFGPRFYRVLLTIKKPQFISLTMHSWDAIEYEGSFSRNSGGRFLEYLEVLLNDLRSQGYVFTSGEDFVSSLNEMALS